MHNTQSTLAADSVMTTGENGCAQGDRQHIYSIQSHNRLYWLSAQTQTKAIGPENNTAYALVLLA